MTLEGLSGIGTAVALVASTLWLVAEARAEVWEFDRSGKLIRQIGARPDIPRNDTYDVNISSEKIYTRKASKFAALYRPMAEGVSTIYAAEPAVVAAGLAPEDFTRLFVALIDQESRFNPRAVSPRGARGLGQLMPGTAAALGVADAFEPMENLRGAARYLLDQLGAFGRADLALAAYNAGPERVSQFQGIPPFRETRDYVARITRAAGLGPVLAAPTLAPAPVVSTRNTAKPAIAAPASALPVRASEPSAPEPMLASVERTQSSPRKGSVLEWTD